MSIRPQIMYDDQKLRVWLHDGPKRNEEAKRLFQVLGSALVIDRMRLFAPVRTGFLRESIDVDFTDEGFVVYPKAPYAVYVEKGTEPHTIFPRTANVLRWYDEAGRPRYAKYVRHPGTVGAGFIVRTWVAVKDLLVDLMNQIWEDVHRD